MKKIKWHCDNCGQDVEQEVEFSPDLTGVTCPKCRTQYFPDHFWEKGLFPCCFRVRPNLGSHICWSCGVAYL